MKWEQAKQYAIKLTGRTPRWCDVRNDDDELAAAPTDEAMDDCIAVDADGKRAENLFWLNQQPRGIDVEAVCYF